VGTPANSASGELHARRDAGTVVHEHPEPPFLQLAAQLQRSGDLAVLSRGENVHVRGNDLPGPAQAPFVMGLLGQGRDPP
jgi:hypothetical protein